jgi:hypothetical protein
MDASTINASTVFVRNANNDVVPATVTYNASTNAATITPTAALSSSTAYAIVVQGGANGVRDASGNALANTVTSAFTTAAPADATPPSVSSFSPSSGVSGVAPATAPVVTFNEAMDASTINASTVFVRNANNDVVPATVTYNASTNAATITPTTALSSSTAYAIVVKGGAAGVKDSSGNALTADVTSAFTTASIAVPPTSTSLWATSTTPAIIDSGDKAAVELGVRFSSTTNGYITSIRFYKGATNTGTHTGSLWSSSGQLLATGTFVNETASGWQTLVFSTPVAITAGVTYVASYHTNSGHYSVSRNYFGSQFSSSNLRVAANGGVYAYGANSVMPSSAYQGSNYWVDIIFTT